MPEPIMVPTMRDTPLNRPTLRFRLTKQHIGFLTVLGENLVVFLPVLALVHCTLKKMHPPPYGEGSYHLSKKNAHTPLCGREAPSNRPTLRFRLTEQYSFF